MNLTQFKAWFEGYTEEMDGAPTTKQWKKIKAKVGEITAEPMPIERIVERYRDYWRPYYSTAILCNGPAIATSDKYTFGGEASSVQCSNTLTYNGPANAVEAFRAIGRADAAAQGTIQ